MSCLCCHSLIYKRKLLCTSFCQENDLTSETNPFNIFKVRPLLKLKLSWSQEPTNGLVNRPKLYHQGETNGVKKETNSAKDRLSTQKVSTSDIKSKYFLRVTRFYCLESRVCLSILYRLH